MTKFKFNFSRSFLSLSSLLTSKRIEETLQFQPINQKPKESRTGLASILAIVADKAKESRAKESRTGLASLLEIVADKAKESAGLSLFSADYFLISEFAPPAATKTAATKIASERGVLWSFAKKSYKQLKGRAKDLSPDFNDVLDGAEELAEKLVNFVKGLCDDTPSDDASDAPSVDVPSPPLPVFKPPSVPRLGKANIWVVLCVIGILALSIVSLPERERCAISTFSLGNQEKLLGKSTSKYDFVGIFADEGQYSWVLNLLKDSVVTDELCRKLIDSMGSYGIEQFIGSIVCGGCLYLAVRGEYRFLLGFADPGEDIALMYLGVLRNGNHWTTVLPISELHHFLLICSANIGEVFDDYELVDLVSQSEDKKNVSREIVRMACSRRRTQLDQIYVAVIFFD